VRRALVSLLDKKYADVTAPLEPVLSSIKNKDTLAEAHYLIGSSQSQQKQYDAAVQSLRPA